MDNDLMKEIVVIREQLQTISNSLASIKDSLKNQNVTIVKNDQIEDLTAKISELTSTINLGRLK